MIVGVNFRKIEEGGLEEMYKYKDWVELRRRFSLRLIVVLIVVKFGVWFFLLLFDDVIVF